MMKNHTFILVEEEVANFYEIGKSLSSEKDTMKLFEMIIDSSIALTASDAGTIYLIVDKEKGNWSCIQNNSYEDKLLKFVIAKNTSIPVKLESSISPITPDSIFGYTVISGHSLKINDAYDIGNDVCYQHNHSYDIATGYKTKSILSIPMKDHNNNTMGVIQLINKKKSKDKKIDYTDPNALETVIPYDYQDDLIMNSLAGQAAVALENNMLYRDMNNLLEEYKQQNNQLIYLSKKILKAHEDERKRIAREIHDGPAQSVANLTLKSEICKKYLQRKDYLTLANELDTLSINARSSVKEIRSIIYDLKPSYLEEGLIYSLKNRLDVFEENTGIVVTFNSSGDDSKIEYYLTSTIYHIVQESLNNIQKHAHAQNVNIKLSILESQIIFSIVDDGRGFDTSKSVNKNNPRIEGGFGLEGMYERVELIRGNISINSKLGKGTQITVKVPL
jgi:signal transduction histidine kinase